MEEIDKKLINKGEEKNKKNIIKKVIFYILTTLYSIIINAVIAIFLLYYGVNIYIYNNVTRSIEQSIELDYPFKYIPIWNKTKQYIQQNKKEVVVKQNGYCVALDFNNIPDNLEYNIDIKDEISNIEQFKNIKVITIDLSNEEKRNTIKNLNVYIPKDYFANHFIDIYEQNNNGNDIKLIQKSVDISNGNVNLSVYDKDKSKEENEVKYILVYVPLKEITLSKDSLEIKRTLSEKINYTILPDNATNKDIKLSFDSNAITVTNDLNVTANLAGEYIFKINILNESYEKEVKVKVLEIADKINVDKKSLSLTVGDTTKINASVVPDNAVNKDIEWKSTNSKIATVSNDGNVKAIYPGNCVIEVKTKEAPVVTSKINVQVKAKVVIDNKINNTKNSNNPSNSNSSSNSNGLTYKNGILIVNKKYGLPSNYNPGVNATALSAFNTMKAAAKNEGINLFIISGFRSYETQKGLYNNYVKQYGQAATDTFSAKPGHSEHQTGLAFDLNSLDDNFGETKEGKWLSKNCHKFGFIIRYPKNKQSITGYQYEPWHVRYLGIDIATKVYNSGLCLEEYLGI